MVQRLAQNPRQVRLGEQVAGLLVAAIRLHEYLPGRRLPSERELCVRLGVNRMAVREGLRWLEHERYIEIHRGKYGGAFVRHPEPGLARERLRGGAEQLRQLFEYRVAIEPFAAALAAERITVADVGRLRALVDAEAAEEDRHQRRALDVEFHQVIADACHNQLVSTAVREIRVLLAPGLDLLRDSPARCQESHDEHAAIIRALGAADATAARRAMQRHVVATEREIRTALVELSLTAALDGEEPAGR